MELVSIRPPVVEVESLSFAYATGARLFDDVSFRIERGQKIALVGSNGAGKSTLLALLAGQLSPDSGKVSVAGNVVWVKQLMSSKQLLSSASGAVERDEDEDDDEVTVESWLEAKATQGKLDFDDVHNIMRALKLPANVPVATLSHGMRYKLRLCATVLQPGIDLLLLDEPTSHLDLAALLFLERFVRRCPVACLIVSHDARFLQATVDTVFELDQATKSLRATTSSFNDYIVARDRRRQAAADAEESRQKRASALEAESKALRAAGAAGARHETGDNAKLLQDFRRDRAGRSMHAAGVKARAKERVLNEERDTDVPGDLLEFDLEGALRKGAAESTAKGVDGEPAVQLDQEHALSLIDAQFGYDGVGEGETAPRLFGPLSITVNVGERILLLGRNGSGKSSALAALAGTLPLRSGVREAGRGVQIGILHQDADCGLNTRETVIAAVEVAAESRKVKRDGHFSRLRHIGISHAAALRPIGELSPGLIVRLALLLLVLRGVNLLVLDEVTNFIDRAAKETLLNFLPTFNGAIVCVTHDRELMQAIHWTSIRKMSDDGATLELLPAEALEEEIEKRSKEADEAISILIGATTAENKQES